MAQCSVFSVSSVPELAPASEDPIVKAMGVLKKELIIAEYVAPLTAGLGISESNSQFMSLVPNARSETRKRGADRSEYLNLLRSSGPALRQSIVRSTAAALLAAKFHDGQKRTTCLVSMDGRAGRLGTEALWGSDVPKSVWNNVLPSEVARKNDQMNTQWKARSTRGEIEALLNPENIPETARLSLVTNEEHAPRVQDYVGNGSRGSRTTVWTPEEVLGLAWHIRDGGPAPEDINFYKDIVAAGALSPAESQALEKEEKRKGAVHRISPGLEDFLTRNR